jgi:hypothetical protein
LRSLPGEESFALQASAFLGFFLPLRLLRPPLLLGDLALGRPLQFLLPLKLGLAQTFLLRPRALLRSLAFGIRAPHVFLPAQLVGIGLRRGRLLLARRLDRRLVDARRRNLAAGFGKAEPGRQKEGNQRQRKEWIRRLPA